MKFKQFYFQIYECIITRVYSPVSPSACEFLNSIWKSTVASVWRTDIL
jgi:hypothetical protein